MIDWRKSDTREGTPVTEMLNEGFGSIRSEVLYRPCLLLHQEAGFEWRLWACGAETSLRASYQAFT
jgi:hypothetical protein